MKLTPYQAAMSARPWPVVGCDCEVCQRIRQIHAKLVARRSRISRRTA